MRHTPPQVCKDWRTICKEHPGYGAGVWKRSEALRQISRALMLGGPPYEAPRNVISQVAWSDSGIAVACDDAYSNLRQRLILPVVGGDEAGCALGALLQVRHSYIRLHAGD